MSEGKLTITIDGDEAKAHAAYMSLTKDQKALVVEIGKMGTAAEKAADQSIQAAKKEAQERQVQIRMADSLVKSNETLTQAYDRQKAALDTALAAGNITAEQHKQTLDSLDKKVQESSQEFIQASREKQEAAKLENAILNDQVKAAGRIVDATKSINQKYHEQKAALDAAHKAGKITFDEHAKGLKHIQAEADKAAKELGKIDDATEDGVGQKSIDKIGEFATKFATIAAAVAIVKKALEFYNAEKEKAIGSTNSLQDVRRQMRQLSNGDFEQMEGRAEELSKFGLDRVQSRQLVADARAMGFEGQEDMVASINPVINLPDATVLAGTFREYFKDENLQIEESFNAALMGAEKHPLGIKEMIPQLATAATGRIAGGESSDIIASVAEMAKVVGLSAGERLRNLGVELATNEKTKGMNMIDAMRLVGQDPELQEEITGGNTVMKATVASYLKMIDTIAATDKEVEAAVQNSGTAKSLITLKAAEAVDPNTVSGRTEAARQQAVADQAAYEKANETAFAETAFKTKGAVDQVNTDAIEQGWSLPVRMGLSAMSNALSRLGFSDETITRAAKGGYDPEAEAEGSWAQEKMREEFNKRFPESSTGTNAATEELKKQTSSIDKQTSAIERQTSAIERMSQFQGV